MNRELPKDVVIRNSIENFVKMHNSRLADEFPKSKSPWISIGTFMQLFLLSNVSLWKFVFMAGNSL